MMRRALSLIAWCALSSATLHGCSGAQDLLPDGGASLDGGAPEDGGAPDTTEVTHLPCPPFATPDLLNDRLQPPIAGALTVFSLNEEGAPLAGSAVVVEGPGRMERVADERGCAYFEHPQLVGPVDVHLFSPSDRPYLSVVGYGGASLTARLPPRRSARRLLTVTGTAAGLSDIEAEAPNEAAIMFGAALYATPFEVLPPQLPRRQTPQFNANVAVLGGPGGELLDVQVVVDPSGSRGVTLYSGLLYFPGGRFPPSAYTWERVGFIELPELTDERVEGLSLEATAPLTSTITVELMDLPGDPFFCHGYVELPKERGFIRLPVTSTCAHDANGSVAISVPPLDGALSGAAHGAGLLAGEGGNQLRVYQRARAGRVTMPTTARLRPEALRARGRSLWATLPEGFGWSRALIGGIDEPVWVVEVRSAEAELLVEHPRPPQGFVDPIRGARPVSVVWMGRAAPIELSRASSASLQKGLWAVSVTTASVEYTGP